MRRKLIILDYDDQSRSARTLAPTVLADFPQAARTHRQPLIVLGRGGEQDVVLGLFFSPSIFSEEMARRIVFEGNIGAGKTSLARLVLNQYPTQFDFYPEPVEEGEAMGHVLQSFYARGTGSGFLAQSLISQTLLVRDVPQREGLGLYERSLFSAKMCFVPAMLRENRLSRDEANILVGFNPNPTGIKF